MLRLKSALVAAVSGLVLFAVDAVGVGGDDCPGARLRLCRQSRRSMRRGRRRVRTTRTCRSRARRDCPTSFIDNTTTWQRSDTPERARADRTTTDNSIGLHGPRRTFSPGSASRTPSASPRPACWRAASSCATRCRTSSSMRRRPTSDVIRDTAILDIRRKNVLFLDEQVRAANERFNVGENTRTDVAQARAAAAQARSEVALADCESGDQPRDLSAGHRPRSERADRRLSLRPAGARQT